MFENVSIISTVNSRVLVHKDDLDAVAQDIHASGEIFQVVAEEDYSAEDFVLLLEHELENANFHFFVNFPQAVLNATKKLGGDEAVQTLALKSVAETFKDFI